MVAELIVKCALHRKESRGLHYNLDTPETSAQWERPTCLRRGVHDRVVKELG